MEKTRKETSGLITSYDPIKRIITIKKQDGNVYEGRFDQTMIDFPTRLVIEIESFCSSGCRYCSEGKEIGCRRNIAKERIFKLINEAEKMKIYELTIRGGEATEHPYFEEIWQYATTKKFLTLTLISNGMYFDTKKIDWLLKNNNAKIVVSLDGFREINNLHRNPKQYDMIMSWLPKAIKKYPNQIVVISCLYRQNYDGIINFAKHLVDLGVKHYHLPPLKRLGRSEMADENFVSLEEMNELQNELDQLSNDQNGFRPVISCVALDKWKENKTKEIPVPLFNEIYYGTGLKITPGGDVMVNRGIMFTDKFKNGINTTISLNPLGNIYKKSLAEIWQETKDIRLDQEKLADKHYAYYLGWLKKLDEK